MTVLYVDDCTFWNPLRVNHALAPEPIHGFVDIAFALYKPLFTQLEFIVLSMLMLMTVKLAWLVNGAFVNQILEKLSNALLMLAFTRIVM